MTSEAMHLNDDLDEVMESGEYLDAGEEGDLGFSEAGEYVFDGKELIETGDE